MNFEKLVRRCTFFEVFCVVLNFNPKSFEMFSKSFKFEAIAWFMLSVTFRIN